MENFDLRIMARAAPDTLAKRANPYLLRRAVVAAVPEIQDRDIPDITPTASGWAIIPRNREAHDTLMKEDNRAKICTAMQCVALDKQQLWHSYLVPAVPRTLRGLTGPIEVDNGTVGHEAEIQTGCPPVRCKAVRSNDIESLWLISFLKPVKQFTLFGASMRSRLAPPRVVVRHHNPGCQGYCNPLRCKLHARCNRCGIETNRHAEGIDTECTAAPSCANCHGPYHAGHKGCPARPTVSDGRLRPIPKARLHEIRSAAHATRRALAEEAKKMADADAAAVASQVHREERASLGGQTSSLAVLIPATPTLGSKVTEHEKRGSKRLRTGPHSLNLAELSKLSITREGSEHTIESEDEEMTEGLDSTQESIVPETPLE